MKLLRQFQASLLIFFFIYEKILNAQKRKPNQNQLTKTQTSEQKTTKAPIFHAHKNF